MSVLLSIQNLTVQFETDEGLLTAVNALDLDVERGEVLGLVGESGSGKSVTAQSILRLVPSPPGRIASGSIHLEDTDILSLPIADLRKIRGSRVGMIFQEPMTALSPLHKIGHQLVETLRLHHDMAKPDAVKESIAWLERVGIPDAEQRMRVYPYQLSGGMRQRVMIAMVLMLKPDLVIADEPTTALDVTIQAQIFDLMREMKEENTAVLLITHDMGVIWENCDRVAVMYASEIVESAAIEPLFRDPQHPYTQALMSSIPSLDHPDQRLKTIPGNVPSALEYPAGCHFKDRCPHASERCGKEHPPLYDGGQGLSRCFISDPVNPLRSETHA